MHRPRSALRSLLAITCGATLLATGMLGTGSAAFAETGDAPSAVETATDAATEPGAPSDAALGEEQLADGLPPIDPKGEGGSPIADSGGTDLDAADGQVGATVDPQPVDGDQSVARPDAEETVSSPLTAVVETKDEELSGPSALPEEIVYTPSLRIDAPASVAMAGDLREFTVTVVDYDLEQADSLVLTLPVGRPWFDLQYSDGDQWIDVPFENRIVDHRAGIPLDGPELLMRIGVSERTFNGNWSRLDEFQSSVIADPALQPLSDGQQQIPIIQLLTQLAFDGAPVGTVETISVPVLSPTLAVVSKLPGEMSAGDTFDFDVVVTNQTGHVYQPSSLIRLFYPMMVLTSDEENLLDEIDEMLNRSDLTEADLEWIDATVDEVFTFQAGEADVSCSVDGGPAERLVVGTETPWGYRSGAYLDLGGLALGSVLVECAITVGEDVPDGWLLFDTRLTLGAEGITLAYDPNNLDGLLAVGIVGTEVPAEPPAPTPEPQPTPKPTPAQPAPIRPMPTTPSNPPAAAPIRKVSNEQLPRTGTDPLPLAAAGLGLVLAGAAALLGGRRRADN